MGNFGMGNVGMGNVGMGNVGYGKSRAENKKVTSAFFKFDGIYFSTLRKTMNKMKMVHNYI